MRRAPAGVLRKFTIVIQSTELVARKEDYTTSASGENVLNNYRKCLHVIVYENVMSGVITIMLSTCVIRRAR